jgi:hypothetical protein
MKVQGREARLSPTYNLYTPLDTHRHPTIKLVESFANHKHLQNQPSGAASDIRSSRNNAESHFHQLASHRVCTMSTESGKEPSMKVVLTVAVFTTVAVTALFFVKSRRETQHES